MATDPVGWNGLTCFRRGSVSETCARCPGVSSEDGDGATCPMQCCSGNCFMDGTGHPPRRRDKMSVDGAHWHSETGPFAFGRRMPATDDNGLILVLCMSQLLTNGRYCNHHPLIYSQPPAIAPNWSLKNIAAITENTIAIVNN